MDLLDPWRDAANIAQRLQNDGAIFVVAVGAQSWCQKCRNIYPRWLELAQELRENGLFLWLDLDEHQEFVGDFMPDDLPWLLIYRGDNVMVSTPILGDALVNMQYKLYEVQMNEREEFLPDPGIRKRLLCNNWAESPMTICEKT